MPLVVGQVLDSFEILGSLGAGGMGEVYRARDTQLQREVALKILPPEFAAEGDRLQRFEREARTLASLNHANIGAIYGVGEVGEICYLALELVPGRDLSDVLAEGPLPLGEIVELGRQIAEALEAAHDAGVVHRDLKPANVRVTPSGSPKVLDFGLAKALSKEPSGDQRPSFETRDGSLLGTPPYMSPEQARGRPTCHRSDVWAFGCLLYEMATGRPPFSGETIADLISKILEQEPDWAAVTDPRLRGLVQRCLAKDPRRRLQHVGEARIFLEDFDATLPDSAEGVSRPSWRLAGAVAAGALLASIAWILLKADPATVAAAETRLTIPLPLDRSLIGLDRTAPPFALAPDGRTLAYVARASHGRSQLFVQRFGQFDATALEGTERGRAPFFSPDGEWIGYFADRGLFKVPVRGGTSFKICDVSISDRGTGCWGEDGTILFTVGLNVGGWVSRVPDTGGEPELVAAPDPDRGEAWFGTPQFLPGDERALITTSSAAGLRLAVMDLETGSRTEVEGTGEASAARLLRDGLLVYCQSGDLMAARFDADGPTLLGPPSVAIESVYGPGIGPLYFDVSPDGTLVFVPGDKANSAMLVLDRSGEELWRSPDRGVFQHPRYSPDGLRMAYDAQRLDGRDLWVYEPRGTRTRLTRSGVNLDPVWSPDGRRVTFRTNAGSGTIVREVTADGMGEPARIENLVSDGIQVPGSFTSAGELIFTMVRDTKMEIWIDSSEGGVQQLLHGPYNQAWPSLSRSGKWLAYVSDETGRNEVHVCTFPDLGQRQTVTSEGGVEPTWAEGDDELFYRNGSGFYSVSLDHRDGLAIGEPALLFTGDYDMAPSGHQHFDVTPDGERFLVIETGQDIATGELRVVLNWTPELGGASEE